MTPEFSGGLIYEYSQEISNYGLVSLNDNGTTSIRTDYDNLQVEYAKLNVTLLESGNATATSLRPPTCDASLITGSFSTDFDIPSIPDGGQQLIDNGIPNPNNGKLVSVTNTQVMETVYDSKGNVIQGLAIKPLPNDQSNLPGENTSGTNAAASPTATKKGAADNNACIDGVMILGALILALVARF